LAAAAAAGDDVPSEAPPAASASGVGGTSGDPRDGRGLRAPLSAVVLESTMLASCPPPPSLAAL